MNNEHLLDKSLLKGYLDNLGQAVIEKMLDLYQQQSALYLDDIASAVDQESQYIWQESCHKMKGASGSVGFLKVHTMLVTLEKSEEKWSVKTGQLAQLEKLNNQSINAFQSWLNKA
ncbi:Hpt domain-containing protein [Thalassotalea piscium]